MSKLTINELITSIKIKSKKDHEMIKIKSKIKSNLKEIHYKIIKVGRKLMNFTSHKSRIKLY